MVKILICPDKFKGSLAAKDVCQAVSEGFQKVQPGVVIESVPLADGGEGTWELLTEWHGGTEVEVQVHGPLFTPVSARYGIARDGDTAFIEMAEASGLALIRSEHRNPLSTTTIGTGELIADALSRKVKNIILGIGGSGTNDAGIGMAAALGYEFCNAGGEVLTPIGENLIHIRHIKTDAVNPALQHVRTVTLCDVTNPLFGPDGAAYVYGPQKGADKRAVELLDAGLRNFRLVAGRYFRNHEVDFPGAGAAGGLGAGTKVFLNATIEKGISFIIKNTRLTEKIAAADLIVTGEGKIDSQTFAGKVVSEVVHLAGQAGKPVIAVCGTCDMTETETRSRGIHQVISLVDALTPLETAMQHTAELLTKKISLEAHVMPGF